jgi:hypothetical protein
VNTETIGKLKQEESGFEAHIFTDSIFIGFHGIVYCTQSALRYSQDTNFLEVSRRCFVAGPLFWLEVRKSIGRESWEICTLDRGAEVRLALVGAR